MPQAHALPKTSAGEAERASQPLPGHPHRITRIFPLHAVHLA